MQRDRSFGFIEPSVQIFEAVGEDGALQQRYLQLFLPERGSCAAAVPAPVQRPFTNSQKYPQVRELIQ